MGIYEYKVFRVSLFCLFIFHPTRFSVSEVDDSAFSFQSVLLDYGQADATQNSTYPQRHVSRILSQGVMLEAIYHAMSNFTQQNS